MNTPKAMTSATSKPLPVFRCGVCGYEIDAATCPEENTARPKPGDFSCCMKCGEAYRFDESLNLVVPAVAQLMAMAPDEMAMLTRIQNLIREKRVLG